MPKNIIKFNDSDFSNLSGVISNSIDLLRKFIEERKWLLSKFSVISSHNGHLALSHITKNALIIYGEHEITTKSSLITEKVCVGESRETLFPDLTTFDNASGSLAKFLPTFGPSEPPPTQSVIRFYVSIVNTNYTEDSIRKLSAKFLECEYDESGFLERGEVWVGDYFIDNNILITTDLVHELDEYYDVAFRYLDGILLHLNAKGFLKDIEIKKKDGKYTINYGADPEYELLENGRVIDIRAEGYAKIPINTHSEIGVDGQGSQLEIRPKPSDTIDGLMSNISKLLKKLRGFHISTKGDVLAIGGHIHIGIEGNRRFSGEGFRKVVKLLDFYLGDYCRKANGKSREMSDYGRLGDTRTNEHGFEYRTPPSSIFLSPTICKIAFNICNLVIRGAMDKKIFDITRKGLTKRLIGLGISKENASLFAKFVHKVNKTVGYDTNVVKVWDNVKEDAKILKFNKPIKMESTLNVEFVDVWERQPSRILRTAISDLKFDKRYRVMLYGIAEDAGDVFSGLNVDGYDTIPHIGRWKERDTEENMVVIGFPYSIRTWQCPISSTIIDALKLRISDWVKNKEDEKCVR